jgi:RNA polymerase sigma-70 factor (ECF subfamily)
VLHVDGGRRLGLDALCAAVSAVLVGRPAAALPGGPDVLLSEPLTVPVPAPDGPGDGGRLGGPDGDRVHAVSSEPDVDHGRRLIALVELARGGDAEAFGLLYDPYQPAVYRFLAYRLGSATLAEDLTSETFVRALRSISSFRWQGKDFGAWLMTIARNLATDHVKS